MTGARKYEETCEAEKWRRIADELARVYRRVCEQHPEAVIEHLPLVDYDIAVQGAADGATDG
jgi:hypothetical protein